MHNLKQNTWWWTSRFQTKNTSQNYLGRYFVASEHLPKDQG